MIGKKDRKILNLLQRDSRLTMQELASRVGMSSSACWRRVKALEEDGVIDRYAVIVNPKKAGFTLSSMTLVSLARHEEKNVENFVKEVGSRAASDSPMKSVTRLSTRPTEYHCSWKN